MFNLFGMLYLLSITVWQLERLALFHSQRISLSGQHVCLTWRLTRFKPASRRYIMTCMITIMAVLCHWALSPVVCDRILEMFIPGHLQTWAKVIIGHLFQLLSTLLPLLKLFTSWVKSNMDLCCCALPDNYLIIWPRISKPKYEVVFIYIFVLLLHLSK